MMTKDDVIGTKCLSRNHRHWLSVNVCNVETLVTILARDT